MVRGKIIFSRENTIRNDPHSRTLDAYPLKCKLFTVRCKLIYMDVNTIRNDLKVNELDPNMVYDRTL